MGLRTRMRKVNILTCSVTTLILVLSSGISTGQETFRYPYYLLDAYNPDDDCWKGVNADGYWPVPVEPQNLLVGQPPSDLSGVTMPIDHWIELKFLGRIVDGPGDDILLIELGQAGEQALIFITDGAKQEYLLDKAIALNSGLDAATVISFDITGISLPFLPCAVRIVALDTGGGSPGFDIANVRARTYIEQSKVATGPIPFDGAENVPTDIVLSWSPGYSAAKHIVYFGTARTFVDANANPVSRQDADSFSPGGLELGRTYFWRIDEINSTDPNSPVTGDIWSFTVADHLVVDDFESYNNDNQIYKTWKKIGEAFFDVSTYPLHNCLQSMAFLYYYDVDFYSEAERTFSPAQDWASIGGKALELLFHGQTTNTADVQMYMSLGDGDVNIVVPYDADMNDIKEQAWQIWRINLEDLAGLNLNNIKTLSIGFRAGESQPPRGGSGTVYFDDIKLYTSRCLEQNRPDADFNGDCAVNFEDLQEMVYSWLDRSPKIYPVESPNAPLAWYRFDGNTNDSSGNGYHGWAFGWPTYVPGIYGQAISFDGYRDSVDITDAVKLFRRISTGITIAFWQYGTDSTHRNDTLCCSNYEYGADNPAIAISLGCWRQPGRYNWDCGYPWSFDSRLTGDHRYKAEWTGRWNHWAFTKDAERGIMQVFLNGALYNRRTDANSHISSITSFEIGSGWYGGYDGLIDDFRIYNYALSQSEVAYIATNGTGVFDQPLRQAADLDGDNQINFRDFAILAGSWLDEQLWP
jgi:hypothetical protein